MGLQLLSKLPRSLLHISLLEPFHMTTRCFSSHTSAPFMQSLDIDLLTTTAHNRNELNSLGRVKTREKNYRPDLMSLQTDGEIRHRATLELQHRVRDKIQCWAYNIHNLAFMIKNDQLMTSVEANTLMQACQLDILDLMPSEQKILTEIVWDTISVDNNSITKTDPNIYINMLKAFTFQNIIVDTENCLDKIKMNGIQLNRGIQMALLDHLCKQGKVQEAVANQDSFRVPWNEELASSFVFGHAANGELDLAENVLKGLNNRNIYWGKCCHEAFVLGCAKAGDVDMLDFFLHKLETPSDELILKAIIEMNREYPDKLELLLEVEPRDNVIYSTQCRRAVKHLVESNNSEAAWQLVRKARVHKMNDSDKERVIRICPSVIIVANLLENSNNVSTIMNGIESLIVVDPKIISRTVPLVIDLAFRNQAKLLFGKELISHILRKHPKQESAINKLVGQSSKRWMRRAATADGEEDVYNVYKIFSLLGLKLEGGEKTGASRRSWDIFMEKLIPVVPEHGSWSTTALQLRCWQVQDELAKYNKTNGGVYSHSVIWGNILQRLFNREDALFFKTAASLIKELNSPYAPVRWVLSLGNCLYKFEDVKSYTDIIEVAYLNCSKKGDLRDLEVVSESLLHFLHRGYRHEGAKMSENHELRVHQVLMLVLDEMWKRGIRMPASVRDKLGAVIYKHGHRGLANALNNVPIICLDSLDTVSFKINKKIKR